MAKTQQCKIRNCPEKHHARGYCQRHYNKMNKYGNPTAGRFDPRPLEERKRGPRQQEAAQAVFVPEPEPRKKRGSGQGNFMYFLNQKTIENLYKEIQKALQQPLYSMNETALPYLYRAAAALAGYEEQSRLFTGELMNELQEWAEARDKKRFMDTLIHWEQRAAEYEPKHLQQMNLFQHQPSRSIKAK